MLFCSSDFLEVSWSSTTCTSLHHFHPIHLASTGFTPAMKCDSKGPCSLRGWLCRILAYGKNCKRLSFNRKKSWCFISWERFGFRVIPQIQKLGNGVIFGTELTWQVLIEWYLTSLLLVHQLTFERSQIGTFQAISYIGVRSPTKHHGHVPNQLPESTANDTCHRDIFKALYSTVQETLTESES